MFFLKNCQQLNYPINKFMDYTALSHGQIESKIWLCETLEPYIPQNANIAILGSWYNILGLMLYTRNPKKHKFITGIDIDQDATLLADKFCNSFLCEGFGKNICLDVNLFDYQNVDVVINCSVEHIQNYNWFYNIPKDTLVCLQTIIVHDVKIIDDWNVINRFTSLDSFLDTFPLSHVYFKGTKDFNYSTLKYTRLMLIGKK